MLPLGVLLRWLSASPGASQDPWSPLSFLSDKTLLLAAVFLGSASRYSFLHVLFEFCLPSSTRNHYLLFCFPLFFCFSIFSSSSHLAGCSLSSRGSASSLPPYLLIFLTHTVILFSVASFILVFPIASSFRRVADLLFCLPLCSFLLSVLPSVSYFFTCKVSPLNQTLCAALKTRWICRELIFVYLSCRQHPIRSYTACCTATGAMGARGIMVQKHRSVRLMLFAGQKSFSSPNVNENHN